MNPCNEWMRRRCGLELKPHKNKMFIDTLHRQNSQSDQFLQFDMYCSWNSSMFQEVEKWLRALENGLQSLTWII